MLSDHEQRLWDDIERFYAAEAEELDRAGVQGLRRRKQDAGEWEDIPAPVVAGIWITIMLIIFGAPAGGLAVAAATALGWWVWRYWRLLEGEGGMTALPVTGEVLGGDGAAYGAEEQPWHRRPRRAVEPE